MVSEQIAKELQLIVKEDYGKDITLAEAFEIMNNMVGYFDLLARMNYEEVEGSDLPATQLVNQGL
jgi:hypothetical protein